MKTNSTIQTETTAQTEKTITKEIPMEIKEALKKKTEADIQKQLLHIALKGCAVIKCKNCYMKSVCNHNPKNAPKIAQKIIQGKIGEIL